MLTQQNKYELKIEELKKYEGFETVSDEEALEAIHQLKELSFILFESFRNQQQKNHNRKSFKTNDNYETTN